MSKLKKTAEKLGLACSSQISVSAAFWLHVLAGTIVIALAVLLIYRPSISGGFIFDDNMLLTDNELIIAPNGLFRFWFSTEPDDYWPVANTSLWLEWRLWGMRPTGYHVTNLILHIASALLLWVILRKLCIPGAFFAALIFAVHPVNVESVSWISQRKGLLAMLFSLL
ncbi:MAG: tetratricopeptide repeat protein, partial [Thermoguttaceae bacterium]